MKSNEGVEESDQLQVTASLSSKKTAPVQFRFLEPPWIESVARLFTDWVLEKESVKKKSVIA